MDEKIVILTDEQHFVRFYSNRLNDNIRTGDVDIHLNPSRPTPEISDV